MCDTHHGVVGFLHKHWPHANIRYCCWQFHSTIIRMYGAKGIEELFWKCVKATNPLDFQLNISDLKIKDAACYEMLMKLRPQT